MKIGGNKNWADLQHASRLEKENKNVRNVNSLLEIEKRMTLENVIKAWIQLAIGKVGINASNGDLL